MPIEENIYSTIRKESDDFYHGNISVVPGYSFNQYETIKRCHLYINSKYMDATTFLGRDKLFFNIVSSPCEVATKMLNIDTKDIRLWPMNPKSHFSTYLLEKELKVWLKKHKLGRVLNQLAYDAPRFGSVVLEKTPDGAEMVDLRKMVNDPTVESIQDSRFVTIISYMTPEELRATKWDNVEEAINLFGNTSTPPSFEDPSGQLNYLESTPYIKVYKRYGSVPKSWVDGGKSDKQVRAMFIVAGADYQQVDDKGTPTGELGVTLFKSRWYKPWPFKDFHYTKVKGRWLGMGVVEMLFDIQERINELKNQKRVSMEVSTIHLFQTKDKTVVRNLIQDTQSGDVLRTNDPLVPVANEERNLQAFESEEEGYMQHADRLSFAYESVRGEALPSSTPATNALIATQQSTSVFAFKRENLGIFLQDFFNDLVMPQLMKDLTPEHIMRFTGTIDELQKIDEAAAELYAHDFVKKRLIAGIVTSPEELENVKEQVKEKYKTLGEARYLKIKDALYDDMEFEFDFLITNEQAEPTTIMANNEKMLTILGSNPQATQDPIFKMFLYKYAEAIGISPAEIELAEGRQAKLQTNIQENANIQMGQSVQATSDTGGGQMARNIGAVQSPKQARQAATVR